MNSNRRRRRFQAGFTLFEMLIVIALIALLAGVTITQMDNILGGGEEDIASTFVNASMKPALTAYRIDMGRYPSTAEGLQALLTAPDSSGGRWDGPYIEGNKPPEDPWRKPYQYRYPGTKNARSYDLYSLGPDGTESADDIGNW